MKDQLSLIKTITHFAVGIALASQLMGNGTTIRYSLILTKEREL